MVVLLLLFLLVVGGGGMLLVRFAKTLEPNQRIVFVLVVVLALVYFVARAIPTAVRAFRAGAEISRQQGR